MSRKLLSILVLLLLIFGIYNFRQGILDNYVSIYAQDEQDEEKPKKEIDYIVDIIMKWINNEMNRKDIS